MTIGMNLMRLGSFTVPGYDLRVNTAMEIKTEDLSGETSATDQASKGIKPKKLTVSLKIRFRNATDLTDLYRVAEAKDTNGDLKVYTIANRTANAIGVRQVRFTQSVNAAEDEMLRQWNVSFTLVEQLSVPEQMEQRENKSADVAQSNPGSDVTGENATGSLFEQLIQRVDGWLA